MLVERLHRFLLLPEEIGKHVTGVATLLFLAMLLTGIVLWWPKKWRQTGQHLVIRWKAKWRRKNYDWHRATGFYMLFPSIVLAITGLSFSYEWMHDALYPMGNLMTTTTVQDDIPDFSFEHKPTAARAWT